MDELLLDTTNILPVFGLAVELNNFGTLFTGPLSSYSTFYNPASLMEAKWIVLGLTRRDPAKRGLLLEAYRTGLKALLTDERLMQTALTSDKVEKIVDEPVLKESVKGYFDRLIYGTAAERNCILLTVDAELLGLTKTRSGPKPKKTLTWNEIAKR